MPSTPPHPCNRPGCPALTHFRFCVAHTPSKAETWAWARTADEQRPTSRQRGYTSKWQRERALYLAAHPTCVLCGQHGQVTRATVVDHIQPHRGDDKLFWSRGNWQSLCVACHARKTARETASRRGNSQK